MSVLHGGRQCVVVSLELVGSLVESYQHGLSDVSGSCVGVNLYSSCVGSTSRSSHSLAVDRICSYTVSAFSCLLHIPIELCGFRSPIDCVLVIAARVPL